ncbi:DUF6339 family protein [Actinomyces ruminicola]|uniref:DUF6339 family protein n=1 Tax=Actinomyces ruminicola TaxID=332524 RepID=UPI0011C8FAC4|nr:DUF6339 family protein [Actinomyces ruminicola]
MRDCAGHYGFGDNASSKYASTSARSFDKAVTPILLDHLDLTWSEASAGEVWSFIALVALPDVTEWRWPGSDNEQRWIGIDLTRHQWSRLWWRGTVFRGHEEILHQLLESEVDQIMSRRTIAGNAAYTTALAEAYLASLERALDGTGVSRRTLLRDLLKRARRTPAYIDVMALDDDAMANLVARLIDESLKALTYGAY